MPLCQLPKFLSKIRSGKHSAFFIHRRSKITFIPIKAQESKLQHQLMELYSLTFCLIFFLATYQPSMILSQQVYPSESQLNCSGNPSTAKGYLCNGHQTTCQSFVTYRATSPYNTPESIASHLASEVSSLTRINNLVTNQTIPENKLIVVPVSCSCFGNLYQHYAPYTVKKNDTYYLTAKDTYQGLTTCQALISQNYYDAENIPVGAELTVPVRCACPSENQTASGVVALVSYVPVAGDTLTAIGDVLGGISPQSILEANINLREKSILTSTPLLIPLRNESCNLRTKNFFCQCSDGQFTYQHEDGSVCATDDGKGSKGFSAEVVITLGVGIGLGLLGLVLCGYYTYLFLKKREKKALKEKFFRQNGGIMMKESLTSSGNGQKTKLFTAEELQRATDSYNESRILGRGGYGTVYKGMLLDGSIVAVKVSKAIDKSQIKQFINEVVILSQINHRNVVKLLGCCLETEFPLLVYEFISNGTLSSHIHVKDEEFSLSWENRFRIACQVAGAVAYMHSAASIPIFHRDIKPTNILLDDNYCAKVSDFGTSRSVPHDKTHLTTAVQGTFGYLDPEYFQSSQFTDKSDVYSFGVVVVELLTGEKPISFVRDEDEMNLVAHFIASTKENRLFQLLDARVAKEAKEEDVLAVAKMAKRCLKLSGKKRPTMKEVAMELECLRKSQKCKEMGKQLKLMAHEDDVTIMRPVEEPTQESIDENVFLEMEPASI